MKRADQFSAMAVLLVAAAACVESVRMGLTKDFLPGSGMFPFLCALGMGLLAAIQVATSRGTSGERPLSWPHGEGVKRIAAFAGALVIYVFAMDSLGFLVSTLLFFIALFRYPGLYGWRTTLTVSVAMTACLYLGLVRLLGVVLPQGFLSAVGV